MSAEYTAIDHYIRAAKADVEFAKGKIESALRWLESDIAGVRRNVANGSYFEELNMTKTAVDVAHWTIRLKDAAERVAILEEIAKEASK